MQQELRESMHSFQGQGENARLKNYNRLSITSLLSPSVFPTARREQSSSSRLLPKTPTANQPLSKGEKKSQEIGQLINEANSELIKNQFIEHQSQDVLQDRELNQFDEFFMQQSINEAKEEEEREECERIYGLNIIFSIILHHHLYPYNAPYVAVSLEDHYPRVDDFRNYYYDIMDTKRWWPLTTLLQIIEQMPYFAYNLRKSINYEGIPYYGEFQYESPIYKEDLLQTSPQFFICTVQGKESSKSIIRSYADMQILFTFSDILILDQIHEHVYTIKRIIELESIQTISKKLKKNYFHLTFNLKQNKMIKLKLSMQEFDPATLKRIQTFLLHYKIMIADTFTHSKQQQRLENYNELLMLGSELNCKAIKNWGRAKIAELGLFMNKK